MRGIGYAALAGIVGSLAVAAIGQSQLFSANAVGFVKKEFPRGGWTLCSVPFHPSRDGEGATLDTILGDQLPTGTAVYYWQTNQMWGVEIYMGEEDLDGIYRTWIPGTTLFSSGAGLFVSVPSDAPESSYTVCMSGWIPASATSAVHQATGWTMFGYPYPVGTNLTATVFGTHATVGDRCYIWASNSWQVSTFSMIEDEFGNLLPAQWMPDIQLVPGMGVFYQAVTSLTHAVDRPYGYPAE